MTIEVDDARAEQHYLPAEPDAELPLAEASPEQLLGSIGAGQPHGGRVAPKLERAMQRLSAG
jgi:hypothetical protein